MNYLVGDVQGCCDALDALLELIAFSPSRDRVYVLGDLVNRGPRSLATLRRLRGLGDAAICLLGNHDLHLLAVAHGGRSVHRGDTFQDVLQAPDRDEWIAWVRQRPMAVWDHDWLMVHAGVVPQWDVPTTLALAAEVQAVLRGPDLADFMHVMYGNEPLLWSPALTGAARLRMVINVLTRIRFCTAEGTLDLSTKEAAGAAPPGYFAWFDAPGRRTEAVRVAFGHWSTLGLLNRPHVLALDTGCVWGGQLTAVRLGEGGSREVIQVPCEQAQLPG